MPNDEIDDFSKRLHQALDVRGYPSLGHGRIAYVQEIFEISRAGANKWLHGKAIPHAKKRSEIAEKLNINLKWLNTGMGSMHDREDSRFFPEHLVHSIPLITLSQAYQGSFSPRDNEIIVNNTIPKNAFGVIFAGSSMEPKFSGGSILIVDRDVKIQDGDYILGCTKVIPEAIFRQYIRGSEGAFLVAINSKFESIKIDENCTIIGKVIEVRNTL